MIISTRHHLKDLNKEKLVNYVNFIEEYSRVCKVLIDLVWSSLPENLSLPKYLDYKKFKIDTKLSARALSSATTQVSGIIRSSIEKQRRRKWAQENVNKNIKNTYFSKPLVDFIAPNLSSKCCDIIKCGNGKFWGFLRIKSTGFPNIVIPIIKHPKCQSNPKGGITLFKNSIQLAWDIPKSPKIQGDKILGLDQGFKTVATLSDGQVTPSNCPHGHSLELIIDKLSRKKRGSKSFKKLVEHRKNFINWSINQLNLRGLKELRIEKISNIRYKKRVSRKMSHWCNPEIRDKIIRRCEELEVPIVEQSSPYRSQRCHKCGIVKKSNRKAKVYKCCNCNWIGDADLNAACNHEVDLPPINFYGLKINIKGFFWNSNGIYDLSGAELRVPCYKK